MKLVHNNTFVFSTGKKIDAPSGILGLSEDGVEVGVIDYGYDGEFCSVQSLTQTELKELVEYMVNLWQSLLKGSEDETICEQCKQKLCPYCGKPMRYQNGIYYCTRNFKKEVTA